jgi:hypothetical protein
MAVVAPIQLDKLHGIDRNLQLADPPAAHPPLSRPADQSYQRLPYLVMGLPTTFVLDSAGRVRAMLRGPQTQPTLAAALAAVGY